MPKQIVELSAFTYVATDFKLALPGVLVEVDMAELITGDQL